MTLREKEIARLSGNYSNDYVHEDVKQKLMKGTDEYVNCLAGQHKAEIP